MEVSIIVVNYNTKNLTKSCIESVISNTKNISYEIILVDNGSNDGSIEYFKNISNIKLIENKNNLGFGQANNIGFKIAKGKYVFLLNSDTILVNNAVFHFYNKAEKSDKKISCFGCILTDNVGNFNHSFGTFPTIYGDLKFQFLIPIKMIFKKNIEMFRNNFSQTNNGYVDYISGSALFIRAEVINEFGFFDPFFFMYYEETDFQKSLYIHGYKSLIIKSPKIIHLEGASTSKKTKNLKKSIIQLKSKLYYFKKWNNAIVFDLYLVCYLTLRIPFLLFSKYDKIDRLSYFKTIISFFK